MTACKELENAVHSFVQHKSGCQNVDARNMRHQKLLYQAVYVIMAFQLTWIFNSDVFDERSLTVN